MEDNITVTTHKIRDNIYCFRGIDKEYTDFHGTIFKTTDGSSYMSYLIIDKEITLIDTISEDERNEFKDEVLKVLDGRKIDNIIINHVEADHSGGYECMKRLFPKAKSFCSHMAEVAMQKMFFGDHEYTVVEDLSTLNTGKYTYTFVLTPFIHWPDNMITYLNEEKILFSNDAFGNLATGDALYDDEYDYENDLLRHSKEYYANIVMPCARYVENRLKEILDLNLEIELICPAHGIIWRKNILPIITQYMEWASYSNIKDKVIMIYDTIWDSTKQITDKIAQGLEERGIEVKVYRAMESRPAEYMTDILDAKAILIGTSNFNNTIVPSVADALERIIGLKPIGKVGMAYGSFGWVDIQLNKVETRLKEANVKIIKRPMYENYKPTEAEDRFAVKVGNEIAAVIKGGK